MYKSTVQVGQVGWFISLCVCVHLTVFWIKWFMGFIEYGQQYMFDMYHVGCSCRANRHVALSFEASRCMSDMGLFFSSEEIEMYDVFMWWHKPWFYTLTFVAVFRFLGRLLWYIDLSGLSVLWFLFFQPFNTVFCQILEMGFALSFYLIEMFDSMGFFWNHRIKKWMQTLIQ